MWYVIQTSSRQEKKTLDRLQRVLHSSDEGNAKRIEAFIPLREVMRHRRGEWMSATEIIFPGYLFVSTNDAEALPGMLKEVPEFTRVLGTSEGFVPLAEDEVAMISAFCGEDHLVRMSEGVIEGDRVRILSGPLYSFDGIIRRVDRHKRAAYVEMSIMGRKREIKLGLEVVRKIA